MEFLSNKPSIKATDAPQPNILVWVKLLVGDQNVITSLAPGTTIMGNEIRAAPGVFIGKIKGRYYTYELLLQQDSVPDAFSRPDFYPSKTNALVGYKPIKGSYSKLYNGHNIIEWHRCTQAKDAGTVHGVRALRPIWVPCWHIEDIPAFFMLRHDQKPPASKGGMFDVVGEIPLDVAECIARAFEEKGWTRMPDEVEDVEDDDDVMKDQVVVGKQASVESDKEENWDLFG